MLEKDPHDVDPSEIKDIKVVQIVVGGKTRPNHGSKELILRPIEARLSDMRMGRKIVLLAAPVVSPLAPSANIQQAGRYELTATKPDAHGLGRFLEAQQRDYDRALAEIRSGRKQTHWMWYVFPQFLGLGASPLSKHYAIRSLSEAEAYITHPILGSRLIECAEAALAVQGKSATDIFGTPDDLKLQSCATLFDMVSPPGSVFDRLLAKYYDGVRDSGTLEAVRGR